MVSHCRLLLIFITLFIHCYYTLIPSLNGNDSGSFGIWKQDNDNNNNFYNLPYYRYTMDQINDKTAIIYNASVIYKTNEKCEINATDHWFQFGNDRVTVISSNYGYIKLRQDETGSKFLNDINRDNNQFGAGIGYLTDNNNKLLLSTWYTGDTNSDITTERDFSFYFRRYATKSSINKVSLEQTLIAPFGDDPVIISKITINSTSNNNNLSYYEVYGGAMYQLLRGYSEGERRRYQAKSYNVSYTPMTGGISADYKFTGKPVNYTNAPGAWLWDEVNALCFCSLMYIYTTF